MIKIMCIDMKMNYRNDDEITKVIMEIMCVMEIMCIGMRVRLDEKPLGVIAII